MLDLTAGAGSPDQDVRPSLARPTWLAAAIVAAGALVVMAAYLGAALVPLLGCAVAGAGITYLSGFAFSLEERLAYGAVLGGMLFALLLLALAIAFGFGLVTVLLALVLAVAAGAAAAYRERAGVRADLADARARWLADVRTPGHPWPLAALLVVAWAYAIHLLSQVYLHNPDGLYAGYVNVWGDWGAHLAYAGSFAFGQNFPPEFPIDPGNHLGYPFMADLMAAALVPFGTSLPSALVEGSGYLALAFPAVMYLAAQRFIGGRTGPALSVLLFLTSGGLGFIGFLAALHNGGPAVLQHLPREYTLDRDVNLQWLNPVLAYLLPQRSALFGFSLALLVLAVLYACRDSDDWRPWLFAGAVAGFTPWFHVHAYGTIVALSVFWAAFGLRRQWLAFFIPALALGVPALWWLWPPGGNAMKWQLGWMAGMNGHSDNWLWFWVLNLGLFIPLLLYAQVRSKVPLGRWRWYFAPLWLWFLVPNVFILANWEWDNTKFFIFWALFGSITIGGLLGWLAAGGRRHWAPVLALVALLSFSGVLDLARATDLTQNSYLFVDKQGVAMAAWARTHTPPKAIFLTSTDHNEPIPALAGRRVVLGYVGWLFTYGLTDYQYKQAAVGEMLRGEGITDELLREYSVSYVVLGPQELFEYKANQAYWQQHGQVVYDDGEYTVYKVVPGG